MVIGDGEFEAQTAKDSMFPSREYGLDVLRYKLGAQFEYTFQDQGWAVLRARTIQEDDVDG
eukprot:scaffold123732_cov33-Phaeocystis_antarctica.AAC.1